MARRILAAAIALIVVCMGTSTPARAMAGRFRWTCEKGDLAGSILLAPTPVPTIQELRFTPTAPR